jgi:hypothetical protein
VGADAGGRVAGEPLIGVDARILRPRTQLITQGRLVVAALTLPIFAAMLWFAIPRGTWPRVIIAFLFITALYLAGVALLRGVSIRIDRDGLVERGFFFHNNRIPAKRMATVVLIDVYNGSTTDTDRQFFLLDGSGELLLRMRGEFWSNDDIAEVTGAFPVLVQHLPDPITPERLRADFPELLYWFERWPWAGRLAVAGIIALFALVLIALMSPSSLVVA